MNKDQRELLELAAYAIGATIEGDADKLVTQPEHFSGGFSILNDNGGSSLWHPLNDDGDAQRIAVDLFLTVNHSSLLKMARIGLPELGRVIEESYGKDARAATRRVITRAAAAIGKQMKARNGNAAE